MKAVYSGMTSGSRSEGQESETGKESTYENALFNLVEALEVPNEMQLRTFPYGDEIGSTFIIHHPLFRVAVL